MEVKRSFSAFGSRNIATYWHVVLDQEAFIVKKSLKD